jgi:starch synthase
VNILLAASELTPLTRRGDLADFCGALPLQLAKLGHTVAVILPAYREVRPYMTGQAKDEDFNIPVGNKTVSGRLRTAKPLEGLVPVYLIEQDRYFDRAALYQQNGQDYIDNCERFVFFCRAVMEAIPLVMRRVDVLHANDWQTGLLPAYLAAEYRGVPGYEHIASVFTVHNVAYQGLFWHWDMMLTGLDWKYFNWQQMEFFGNLSLLKTALVFADALTTVSPGYAQEIQTPPQGLEPNETGLTRHIELPRGCGLEGVLASRREVLMGIVNGVDGEMEQHDGRQPPRAANPEDVAAKSQKKRALLQELELPQAPDTPLIAVTGPLMDPHGADLITAVLQNWLTQQEACWVFAGEAGRVYRDTLSELARRYPAKLAVRFEGDETLLHRVLGGADLLAMAPRTGPGGMQHLRAMRLGTIPVAYQSGIPADTILDATAERLATGEATGFLFQKYSTAALHTALIRACALYRQKTSWSQLVNAALRRHWSWRDAALRYVQVYERAIKRTKGQLAKAKG